MKVKLLLTFALLLTAVTGAWADESGSCGEVSYSYVESTHTLTISGTGAMADYPNPSERPWDSYVEEIETVIIEDGVTGIGNCAFYYCTSLTSVTIPASVTSIGFGVFSYCSNLSTMTVEAGNKVYDSRNSCNAIIEKETNTLIAGCKNTKIPDDVTSIGDVAFVGCTSLTTITIPDGVTSIGPSAFSECGLTSIEIPASVTSIGDYAFDGCSNLATMTVETGNTVYDSRNGCNAIIEKESNTLIFGCKNTKIPDDVTSIGDDAFQGCAGLTSVTIPDGVTRIGNYAFESCTGLTTVTIGSGVTYIGTDAFFNCTKVEIVYCNADPEKLEWEGNGRDDFKYDGSTIIKVADAAPWIAKFGDEVNGIFSDKPYVPLTWNYDAATKTLTFSGTAIPSYNDPDERPWIAYVAEVENIVIEDDVTSIGNYAFYGCSGLTTVTIGSGVTYIGMDVFYDCKNVEVVYCNADPEKLEWEESCCDDFKEDGTTIIQVADAAPWIAKFTGKVNGIFSDKPYVPLTWNYDADTKTLTFSGTVIPSYNDPDERPWKDYVEVVEKIVFNEGVRGIGNYAFGYCASLTTVTIPAGVTRIGNGVFYGCSGLTTVTIPASVTSIGYDAFRSCSSLTSVTIPASVTSIGVGVFAYCSNLATMTVDAGNTKYDSRNGCNAIIEKESNTLIAGCKNTIIPDDVTNIDINAFEGCISLTTVTIPAGVTRIGDHAFSGCDGLTTVTIPAGVTSIGGHAFEACSGLTTVTIGSGVTYIGYDAFFNCTAVTDVYCYADPDALTWEEGGCDDFMVGKATKCHVTDATKFKEKWSTGDPEVDVNVDFVGAPKAETKAAGEEYWSSYYYSAAHLKADDNTTVYKATLSGTTVTLTEITDKVITAGQAVLLKKTTADPVELTPCATGSTDDYSGNDLEGVDAETAKESGFDYYVLSYKDSKLSFYKYSGATLGANKAFFKIPANSSREFLDILGEVTGIDGRYKMEDGRSDVYYDLNGRRVLNPTKGIYINNGQKVVIK